MFSPLYIKTNNTILSSIIKLNDLINYAKENNIKALTITDENMYGTIDFYKKCEKENIKPIIGLEVDFGVKIVLYAKGQIGYKNLIKLATLKTETIITPKILNKYSSDLVCIIPFKSCKYYKQIARMYDDVYQGYTNLEERSKLIGENLVYLNETLYLEKKDEEYLKYSLGIKEGKSVSDVKIEGKNNFLVTEDKLRKLPKIDLENNYQIVDMCNLEIKYTEGLLPKFECEDSYEKLKINCIEGLKRIFGNQVSIEYKNRLKHELNIINQMNFCDYFLVVADFIKYAKDNDIYIGPGRGSAAGSLVSYLLNITTVDPLKYNLLFERFLNPERVTMPDIDIDIEDVNREKVLNYCIEKYGMKRVVPIIAFGTMKSKQAIRDVGRTMGIDIQIIDYISKQIDSNKNLQENFDNKRLKEYIEMDEVLKKLYEVAMKLEGIKRNTTIHAAGVLMSNVEIDEVIPLDKSHKDFYTTQFDMTYLEDLGLLKMDFLSLKTLSTLHSINNDTGNIRTNLNDFKTLEIFKTGDTLGIFQFESEGMKNFLRKLKPSSFDDIVAANALFRPGPEQFIDNFINRKYGKEKIDYILPCLEEILKPTYGIMVYQEQIMETARVMAGYSLGEADLLRRAMGKKKENIIKEQKNIFIKKSMERGHSKEDSIKVYEMILKFAQYGFNKSHSLAYSVLSYKLAYLKAHKRPFFMKNLLNNTIGADLKLKEYLKECKKHGIKIIMPNINISKQEFIASDDSLVFPLTGIKGIGKVAVEKIVEEQNKKEFIDIFDFLKRCYSKAINKKIVENLILAGAFDLFNVNRQTLMLNIDNLINYAEISEGLDFDIKPELKVIQEFNEEEMLQNELEMFGFYLSKHPVEQYRNKNHIKLCDIGKRNFLTCLLLVNSVREINTKNGKKMAFMTANDEDKEIDLVMFSDLYEKNNYIKINNIIEIKGKYELRDGKEQIVLNDLKIIK